MTHYRFSLRNKTACFKLGSRYASAVSKCGSCMPFNHLPGLCCFCTNHHRTICFRVLLRTRTRSRRLLLWQIRDLLPSPVNVTKPGHLLHCANAKAWSALHMLCAAPHLRCSVVAQWHIDKVVLCVTARSRTSVLLTCFFAVVQDMARFLLHHTRSFTQVKVDLCGRISRTINLMNR